MPNKKQPTKRKRNPATQFWMVVAYKVGADPAERAAINQSIQALVAGKKTYAARTTKDRDFFAFKRGGHKAERQLLYLYKDRDARDKAQKRVKGFLGNRVSARIWNDK